MKEMDLVFCIAYSPQDYAQALGRLAAGDLQVDALITSRVDLRDGRARRVSQSRNPGLAGSLRVDDNHAGLPRAHRWSRPV